MPLAARMGDMTAHGGSIVVGDPTVLINGMPAARQGDMHVCPMVTGTVPHVGGPIAMGSTTVFINKMPAARMGDMCVCCGPPSTVAMGEPTVQINDGGGMVMIGGGGGLTMIGGTGMTMIGGGMASGGGGGGGAGGPGGKAAMQSAAAATALQPEETELQEPFLAAELTDGGESKQSSRMRRLTDPDGNEDDGFIAGGGKVQKSRIESEGDGEIAMRSLSRAQWSTEEAKLGEEVTVSASAAGFEDGTEATVLIKRVSDGGGGTEAVIEAEVSGEEIEAAWTYETEKDEEEDVRVVSPGMEHQSEEVFVAEVVIDGHPQVARTSVLRIQGWVAVKCQRSDGVVYKNSKVRLTFSSGEPKVVDTGDEGVVKLENVPVGPVRVVPISVGEPQE